VNADVLARELALDSYSPQSWRGAPRELVKQRESFVFETVFPTPWGQTGVLLDAVKAGYTVVLCFIESPAGRSEERVAMRVSQGGHDVPTAKLLARFPAPWSISGPPFANFPVRIYDNDNLRNPFRPIAIFQNGEAVSLNPPCRAGSSPDHSSVLSGSNRARDGPRYGAFPRLAFEAVAGSLSGHESGGEPTTPEPERVAEFGRQHRTGLVTLLFTDVVGSTALKQHLVIRPGPPSSSAINNWSATRSGHSRGRRDRHSRDSFFLLFAKPSAAVQFALQIQQQLHQLNQDQPTPLRIRIGIHVGEVVIQEYTEGPSRRICMGCRWTRAPG